MNTKIKNIFITLSSTLGAILFVTTVTYAIGSLTPSGTAGDDTQVSLNDIYGALDDFSNHTVAATTSPFAVPGTLSESFYTLSEIYALISAESSDLVPENVAENVEIFGVEGTLEQGLILRTDWSNSTSTVVSYNDAVTFCNDLVEDGTNWSLPSSIELHSAYLEGITGFDTLYALWAIDSHPTFPEYAYVVEFQDGTVLSFEKVNDQTAYAQCIR